MLPRRRHRSSRRLPLGSAAQRRKSFTANFEQTTKVSSGSGSEKGLSAQHMNQTFKGVMKVERPGKFFWETASPSKQTIVTSREKRSGFMIRTCSRVKRQNLDDQVANTPALLLSGNASQIMKSYRVTQSDKNKTYYTLHPKAGDGAFQSSMISFGANKAPALMILANSLGQTYLCALQQCESQRVNSGLYF